MVYTIYVNIVYTVYCLNAYGKLEILGNYMRVGWEGSMPSQWQLYVGAVRIGIKKSIAHMRFGITSAFKNKFMFLFILVYFIIFMLIYKNNYGFITAIPGIGFFVQIIQDFSKTFLPGLKLNVAPFFPYILMVLIGAELIKIALLIRGGNKKIEFSDFYRIKTDLIKDSTTLLNFLIASTIYWSIFNLPLYPEILSVIWYPVIAIVIYLVIKWLFYGFFIFDEERAGPFKAFKRSSEITNGCFLYLCCFMLVTLIMNCVCSGVITFVITICCRILSPERSQAEILQFISMGPIVSMCFTTPIVIIAQADIYRSLKAQFKPGSK